MKSPITRRPWPSPTTCEYRTNIAAAYFKIGREEDAEEWYKTALERDSTFEAAVEGMAMCAQAAGPLCGGASIRRESSWR